MRKVFVSSFGEIKGAADFISGPVMICRNPPQPDRDDIVAAAWAACWVNIDA